MTTLTPQPQKGTPSPTPKSLIDIPNELILQIVEILNASNLNNLLRVNHLLKDLLSPVLLKRAATLRLNGRSILHWSSAHNREYLVAQLLEQGANANINTKDSMGMTALHSGILLGNEVPVKLLLENGAKIGIKNQYGWNSLVLAVISGNHSIVRLLLEKGANVDSIHCNKNVLHYAAGLGYIGVVEVLIEMGCNTKAIDSYGMGVVQNAVACGNMAMVERILEIVGPDETPEVDVFVLLSSLADILLTKLRYKIILAFEQGL